MRTFDERVTLITKSDQISPNWSTADQIGDTQ